MQLNRELSIRNSTWLFVVGHWSLVIRHSLWMWLTVFATAASSAHAATEPMLTLVVDGKPNAAIVLPAKPSGAARQAADVLSDHLFQMSGARLQTFSETKLGEVNVENGRLVPAAGKAGVQNFILVGEGDLTRRLGAKSQGLGPGGTLIRTYPNALVLLGPDESTPSDRYGTRYAVTTLLEDVLGCRYLWPGEGGKVVPERKTIAVGPLDREFTPLLRQRRIRSVGYSDRVEVGLKRLHVTKEDFVRLRKTAGTTQSSDAGWFGWQRLGGSLALRSGHAFGSMWQKYAKDHPDWFALQPNGSRDQSKLSPHRSRLCVSNLELIEAIARKKIEELNRTGAGSVSVGPNDGGRATFCMCSACKKLDPPNGRKITLWDFTAKDGRKEFEYVSLTDRFVYFWNEIAVRVTKVHPDAWLTADAYSAYRAPPMKRTLHSNLAIRFVNIHYLSDEARRQGRADWDVWARAASKLYFRPNLLLAGRRRGTPAVYVHKLAEDFRYMAHHSMIGTDFDACAHNWATQGLNYYVLAKLHWDPGRDVDTLVDDYCRAGFGPAAKHVKRYLMRLEKLTDEIAAEDLDLTAPYTPNVIGELRGYLTAATRAAEEEPAVKRRIAFLSRGLDYTEVHAAVYRLLDEYNEAGRKLSADLRRRAAEALDRNWLISRSIFEHNHFAVNVAYVAWGGWGYFGRLGWRGPSPETEKKVETDTQNRPGE